MTMSENDDYLADQEIGVMAQKKMRCRGFEPRTKAISGWKASMLTTTPTALALLPFKL